MLHAMNSVIIEDEPEMADESLLKTKVSAFESVKAVSDTGKSE